MHAFSVSRTVTVHDAHGQRRLPAARARDAAGGLDPASVVLAIHDADAFARRALDALPPDPDGTAGCLHTYAEADLAGWPGWPMRLGRPDPDVPDAAGMNEAPMPLPAQLARLRARHPDRRHVRIALVGGFGYNLGDTLVGATAWRLALPTLRAALPDLSADVLLGPLAGPACAELIGHEPGIGRVHFRPPTLQDFARYDAYFDFTGLVRLPGFHAGAALDWVLWWLGLDPAALPAAEKSNRLRLPEEALVWARGRLAAVPSPRVLFVWRASTPLRSMPDAVAAAFARDLLAEAPGLTLVTESPLALPDGPHHARLLDLGAEADSPERMMALVACADGLISIDSLALHVADAADVPCLLLLNSLPPERFPYYPGTRVVVPAGMEALPGWGLTKLPDADWAAARDRYAEAWAQWCGRSARESWLALAEQMAMRPGPRERAAVATGSPYATWRAPLPPAGSPFPLDRADPLDDWIDSEILRFARTVLRPGATVVLASGGPALALARLVAPEGAAHVLEPRRLRAQALAAEAHAAGLATLHLWPGRAGPAPGREAIPDFDPAGEADPARWGNLARTVPAMTLCLDLLPLAECQLIVLRRPQDAEAALGGAASLLETCRPLIIAGPLASETRPDLRNLLAARRYAGWLSWPNRDRSGPALLLAAPREIEARFEGFLPL